MQLASVTVRLGGDLNNTVRKHNVTPGEVLLLRAIHGEDAVVDVEASGSDKRPHGDEKQRLFSLYGNAKNSQDTPVFMLVFPGAVTRLPVALSEVGIDIEYAENEDTGEEAIAPAKRGRKPKAAEAETDSVEDKPEPPFGN